MPRLRFLASTLALVALVGCGDEEHAVEQSEEMSDVGWSASVGRIAGEQAAADGMGIQPTGAAAPPAPPPPPPVPPAQQRPFDSPRSPAEGSTVQGSPAQGAMLIRTGDARIEVDSLRAAVVAVERAVAALGGWVAESSLSLGEQQWHTARLVLKVPSARWEDLVRGLGQVGELRHLNTGTEDVGEQFVDLSAQLANAERLEDRYLQLLQNQTGSLEDLLAVERELARVRERIEMLQGRLRYLEERVATSTLVVHLEEETNLLATSPGTNPLVDAFREAWHNFLRVITGGIALLGALLPIALLFAGAVALWRGLRARRGGADR